MTGKPIDLRRHRKQKQRETARADADANAAQHGMSKLERGLPTAQNNLESRRLDGHRIEDTDDQG
jgi:hypothetical protein